MLGMLVATLREGIEAFLIVAIAATCLRKTGRAALLPAVWWGSGIDNAYWHLATESWAEGLIGEPIVAAMVLAPLAWIALRHLESRPLNGRDARNWKD